MQRICFLGFTLVCFSLFSQSQDFKITLTHKGSMLPSMIEFPASSVNFPNLENAGVWFIGNLKASPSFALKYQRSFFGQDSLRHVRFQQYYGRFPVEYAEVTLHQKGNRTRSLTGVYYPQLQVDTTIILNHDQALQNALSLFPNSVFKWELPQEENLLKEITNNHKSTYYPKGSLVIFRTGVSADNVNFRVAYKFDIYAEEPHSRKLVYIDARTGQALDETEQICSIDRVGIAHTKYSGIQSITCDSIGPDSFRLSETGRGKGIRTIDARVISATDSSRNFTDSDNIWNNVNANKDEVATDVHWASEKTYDYYLSAFNRNSFDDSGGLIFSKVHVNGKNTNNAYWSGFSMNYGDGDGITFSPLTSIDICGHELSHGVTQYAAGLKYKNESGALNESFSDIFGKCIEFYAKPAQFTWLIGDKIKAGTPLRNMEAPYKVQNPWTYYGYYYYKKETSQGGLDNGGVHTNSGVQNYWFYLLCRGGDGNREKDNKNFRIDSIGMEKAAKIAYLSLNGYLYPEAEYYDMAFFSIEAARSLYGPNSNEVRNVQNAWFAVGLFDYYTEIKEPVSSDKWQILPNPSSQMIRLSNPDINAASQLRMTDITGKVLMNATILPNESIDVSGFARGIYFITINDGITLKFVKEL